MRRLAAAVLLAALPLAGCLGGTSSLDSAPPEPTDEEPLNLSEIEDRLTDRIYEEIQRTEHTIDGHGDAEIWLDVYRPANADGEVPVILVMTPYQIFGDAAAPSMWQDGTCEAPDTDDCPYSPWLVDYFAPRGYAVAFADVRGNHNSGGCIAQSGPRQWQDGVRVVEWLGTRNWSNGKVGMYGASYDGETQVTTAMLEPAHLETIVPTASVSSQYGYIHYDGVPYELQGVSTMAAYLAISAVPGTEPTALANYHERYMCQPDNLQAAADLSGDYNDYWRDRDYRRLADQIDASILQVHGLQDWNVKPDHVWEIASKYETTTRFVLGQWDHAYPDSYCGQDETLCREDWTRIVHRWYAHELKGIDTGILDDLPPVLIQDDTGEWRSLDAFPATAEEEATYHLTADGALTTTAPKEATETLRDVPRETTSGQVRNAIRTAAEATGPPTRLVFETEALDAPLHYTGRPSLELHASTEAESTHWVVHLLEVDDDGNATWTNRGYLDTRHRDGVDDPEPLEPGATYNVSVTLFPQDDVIESGHKLRLVLTNDDAWVHQDDTFATHTVRLGPDATRLTLPLAPTGSDVPGDALRPSLAEGPRP